MVSVGLFSYGKCLIGNLSNSAFSRSLAYTTTTTSYWCNPIAVECHRKINSKNERSNAKCLKMHLHKDIKRRSLLFRWCICVCGEIQLRIKEFVVDGNSWNLCPQKVSNSIQFFCYIQRRKAIKLLNDKNCTK
jgi:hypothetical protein